jgi:hypothetical protein
MGWNAKKGVIKRRAEGVNLGRDIWRISEHAFRGEVIRGAPDKIGYLWMIGFLGERNTEIRQECAAPWMQKNVLRLDVAVVYLVDLEVMKN